jgi:CheY-like chemotaxis protein
VFADPCNLEQIIINLAANARDAMPQGGRLTIRTESVEDVRTSRKGVSSGRYACLSVSDTGCGMDPETLQRLFEPFFTTKAPGRGTGMGLATVQTLVEQHRGFVEVTSAPREGSSFRVFLPASDRLDTAFVRRAAIPSQPNGRGTVLIVEDERSVRRLMKNSLQRMGYRVFAADGAEKAQAIWQKRRGRFDVLVVDLVIPGGTSGQTLAEKFRSENTDLRIVLTTGYSLESVGLSGDYVEGGFFIPKPFTPRQLAEVVAAARQAQAAPLQSPLNTDLGQPTAPNEASTAVAPNPSEPQLVSN